jgi:hypothetical protein
MKTKAVSIDGFEDVLPFDEKALQKAVAHQPVSVAIEASGMALQFYQSVSDSLFMLPKTNYFWLLTLICKPVRSLLIYSGSVHW